MTAELFLRLIAQTETFEVLHLQLEYLELENPAWPIHVLLLQGTWFADHFTPSSCAAAAATAAIARVLHNTSDPITRTTTSASAPLQHQQTKNARRKNGPRGRLLGALAPD